jgi:hypothetical protein
LKKRIQEQTESVAVRMGGEWYLQQRGLAAMLVGGKGEGEAVKEVAESAFPE